MKGTLHTIFSRGLIIMMSFLVCLNCAAKREIKQALAVPVSQSQHPAKVNGNVVCTVAVASDANPEAIASHPKSRHKHFYGNNIAYTAISITATSTHPFAVTKPSAKLPIYILYEQFLI